MSILRLQTVMTGSWVGGAAYNSFHFRTSGDAQADIQNSAETASNALKNLFTRINFIFAAGTLIRPGAQPVDIETGEEYTVPAWSTSGGAAAGVLPSQTCITLSYRTALRSRSGRGRSYIGPLSPAAIGSADGTPLGAAISSVQTIANEELVSAFLGPDEGAFVVWSPTLGQARDIISVRVPDVFAHLTSRRR